jgi:hypothetical protein
MDLKDLRIGRNAALDESRAKNLDWIGPLDDSDAIGIGEDVASPVPADATGDRVDERWPSPLLARSTASGDDVPYRFDVLAIDGQSRNPVPCGALG